MATSLDDDLVLHWATRLDGEPLSDDEQSELDRWLGEDERRQGALLRAQAALAYLDRGRALSSAPETQGDEHGRLGTARSSRRGVLVGGGILSAAAAAGLAGFLLFPPGVRSIQTQVGEVRRVPLGDGSIASLNTGSKIGVAMAKTVRRVTLDEGEAYFQVAHDKSRPFIVQAGDARVEAVGTAFSVRRRSDGAEVLVTDGIVDAWVVGRESDRRRIAAGARGFIGETASAIRVEQAPQSVDRALAWRSGEIALNGESLAYAVAEINRYNKRQIVIEDPALAKEPLVGYFRTNEPENFGRAVAGLLDARVVESGDTIRLERARS